MKRHKKGVLDQLEGLFVGLGVLAIIMAVIFLINAEARDQVSEMRPCSNTSDTFNSTDEQCYSGSTGILTGTSAAWNATVTTTSSATDVPGWLPIVVIVIIGGILLTLVRFFRQ